MDRDPEAVREARAEHAALLSGEVTEVPRRLQRDVREVMTEHAWVVRSEEGLRAGIEKIAALEERAGHVTAHPDVAGFDDLAHAFDLKGSLLAARATLECALERRETRGCHNRSDFPEQDPALRGNMTWTPQGGAVFEPLPEISAALRELVERPADDSPAGKLVE